MVSNCFNRIIVCLRWDFVLHEYYVYLINYKILSQAMTGFEEDEAEWVFDYRLDPYTAPNLSPEQNEYAERCIDLLCRKGVFPFSWLSSPDRLQATSLPARACFYNDLADEECKEADYEHAMVVWREFECGTMGKYLLLYLACDVLLLASVYERFRQLTLQDYSIDPAR